MSGNPNRLDETGVQDRSDRANLVRLLREARIVIVQMVILVQNMHRYREEYREELVADLLAASGSGWNLRTDLVVQLRQEL